MLHFPCPGHPPFFINGPDHNGYGNEEEYIEYRPLEERAKRFILHNTAPQIGFHHLAYQETKHKGRGGKFELVI